MSPNEGRQMAHRVWIDAGCIHVKRGGVEFIVNDEQGKSTNRIGTLLVTNGKLSWWPSGCRKPVSVSWEKLESKLK